MSNLLDLLGIQLPIIQAPMAGVSTPAMAASVTGAGGLGSISLGAADAVDGRAMIREVRERTGGPFNVNLFTHRPAASDPAKEAAWIERFRPLFDEFDAPPPRSLREIYKSFVEDDQMLEMLLEERPPIVSFHFGLPDADRIGALKAAGVVLLATATSLPEARAAAFVGVDAVVAQGWEAGGHRGLFDPDALDEQLGTSTLVALLASEIDLPIIASGGIMDGAGIAAALKLGASAAQLGTAFIAADESLADEGYRTALANEAAHHTVMTRAISGRPARGLSNRFTAIGTNVPVDAIPTYPIAYDLGKALNAAARAKGEYGFGAQWAGQRAPLSRPMPAGQLVRTLAAEIIRR